MSHRLRKEKLGLDMTDFKMKLNRFFDSLSPCDSIESLRCSFDDLET
jgi:hypothetical protein